jgi:hypothetical protein
MALLAALLRDESLIYTSFTPNPTSWATLLAQRFTPLDSHHTRKPREGIRGWCGVRYGDLSAADAVCDWS